MIKPKESKIEGPEQEISKGAEKREKIPKAPEAPESKESEKDWEGLKEIEEGWRKEELKTKEELQEELEKARQKVAQAKEEREKKKNLIFDRIKEFVGLSSDELIRFDDLILDDREEAWRLREEEAERNRKIIATTAGIKSERARDFLKRAAEFKENWGVVSIGLIYNDSAWADEIRKQLASRKVFPLMERTFRFLKWHKSERFFKRRRVLSQILGYRFFLPGDLLLSETGVPATNQTKQELWRKFKDAWPVEAILCHLGDSSIEAQDMVKQVYRTDKERLRWAYERYEKSIET